MTTPGRPDSAKKKAQRAANPPLAQGGRIPPGVLNRVTAARAKAKANTPMSARPREERRPEEYLDFTEPDDIQEWMAGALRDWELQVGVKTFEMFIKVCKAFIDEQQTKLDAILGKGDLRQEGYLEGEINAYTTIMNQSVKAIEARQARIGEVPPE